MHVHIFARANEYIEKLSSAEQAIIRRHIEKFSSGDIGELHTKHLRGAIRELIVGHHRLSYFPIQNHLYIVRGFQKKTAKTPKQEILYALRVYKMIIQRHKEL